MFNQHGVGSHPVSGRHLNPIEVAAGEDAMKRVRDCWADGGDEFGKAGSPAFDITTQEDADEMINMINAVKGCLKKKEAAN